MRRVLFLGLALTALTACETEVDTKPAAQVKEIQAPLPEAALTPASGTMPALPEKGIKVDAASSKIGFIGAKVTGTHDGGFKDFTGYAVVEGEELTETMFIVDMKSTFSDAEKLTKHLKSADFFSVEANPASSFTSTSIVAGGEGGTHTVTGILDLRGQKKELTFPATITVAADMATFKSEFKMNRQVWGIAYPGKPDDLIKDDVAIVLDLSFPRS
ncbi:MAG: polyisoprenoid-binding protein YceI [Cognaticolwellia sp.]|jgi:polyisoprenoid-binding protein YceI